MFILSGNYSVLIKADGVSFILQKKQKKTRPMQGFVIDCLYIYYVYVEDPIINSGVL